MINQQTLKQYLLYCPLIGVFTWRIRPYPKSKQRPGDIAGSDDGKGYTSIGLLGSVYKAHRLAWLYVYGEWPNGMIDHIDGVTKNNTILNLRIADYRSNGSNRYEHRRGKLVGASYLRGHVTSRPWQASMMLKGKRVYLGVFATELEAHNAYLAEVVKLRSRNE